MVCINIKPPSIILSQTTSHAPTPATPCQLSTMICQPSPAPMDLTPAQSNTKSTQVDSKNTKFTPIRWTNIYKLISMRCCWLLRGFIYTNTHSHIPCFYDFHPSPARLSHTIIAKAIMDSFMYHMKKLAWILIMPFGITYEEILMKPNWHMEGKFTYQQRLHFGSRYFCTKTIVSFKRDA